MPLASKLGPMVRGILDREGQVCTLKMKGASGVYDPATGTNTQVGDSSYSIKACFLGYSSLNDGFLAKTNTLMEDYSNVVYLSSKDTSGNALPRCPSPAGDLLIDASGAEWRIILIKEYNPSGTSTIMYEMAVAS